MNIVLTYLESQNDFHFFKRFTNALKQSDLSLVCMVNKLSLAIKCHLSSIPYRLVKTKYYVEPEIDEKDSLKYMREIVAGELSNKQTCFLYGCVKGSMQDFCLKEPLKYVFIMNGESVPTKAIATICKNKNIPILFFELANIPQKIFVDPKGVNAESSLYHSIKILEKYEVEQYEYLEWKKEYYKNKMNDFKKIRILPKIRNYLFLLDLLGFWIFNIPANGEINICKKIRHMIQTRLNKIKYDEYDYKNKKYIFLPLQLTYDTQLLKNSSFTTQDAIMKCCSYAKEMNVDLIVKMHPLETDKNTISMIKKLKENENYYLVSYNTFDIVLNSIKIITINSTVGLEGMICEKEVIFLGKSFYPLLTPSLIKNYLLSYLVNIDYYSKEQIQYSIMKSLMNRIELRNDEMNILNRL